MALLLRAPFCRRLVGPSYTTPSSPRGWAQQPGRARRISPTRTGPCWPHRGCIKGSTVDSIHSSPFILPSLSQTQEFIVAAKGIRAAACEPQTVVDRALEVLPGSFLGLGESFIWWRCSRLLACALAISHRAPPSAAESPSSWTTLFRPPFSVSTLPNRLVLLSSPRIIVRIEE
jgi:hypothetical protein